MWHPPVKRHRPTGPRRRARRVEPLLLEVAWEACNQVGGIYTVLRSKVPSMVSRWGNRYCLIGPYIHASAQVEFEPSPMVGAVGQVVKLLREMGFGAHYGRWLVSGRPHVVLLNHQDIYPHLHEVKYRLYADHDIPSPGDDPLINDVAAFGEIVRLFLSKLGQAEAHRRRIIAHFHEWMSGPAIPMLRKEGWPGTTVFTTHATVLGRYLATNDPVFYDHLSFFDADAEARHFNIECQHRIECAAAHGSQVFTTVSDVTAQECEHLLGRKVDVLLPNGLNIQRFAGAARVPEPARTVQAAHPRVHHRPLLSLVQLRPRHGPVFLHFRALRVPQQGDGSDDRGAGTAESSPARGGHAGHRHLFPHHPRAFPVDQRGSATIERDVERVPHGVGRDQGPDR